MFKTSLRFVNFLLSTTETVYFILRFIIIQKKTIPLKPDKFALARLVILSMYYSLK